MKVLFFTMKIKYDYWKECLIVYIQSVNMDVWDSLVSEWFEQQADWTNDDKKKVQYNLKVRNILICAVRVNEYHSVSHCKISKAIWDALESLLEGTEDVKKSKINTHSQQYELFHVDKFKTISFMQMRFTCIVNKIKNLGKTIPN